MGQKNTCVDMKLSHIPGKINYFSDAASRGPIVDTLDRLMRFLIPSSSDACRCLQIPSSAKTASLRRFLPSLELLSWIEWALLLQGTKPTIQLNRNNVGQMSTDSTILFSFANPWTWTLHSED